MSYSWFLKNGLVHRLIEKHLQKTTSYVKGVLVDVGCGTRQYETLFKPYVTRYIGLEYPSVFSGHTPYDVAGDALRLPYKTASVDTVLSNQVIEHVPEPWTMVDEMARILKPDGILILSAPHIWGIHNAPEDYYRFTCYGLQFLMERAGLEVLYVHAMAGFWVTAGIRFCYYLTRVVRPVFLLPPLYALVQIGAYVLDHVHLVEGDTWNYIAVAKKPEGATK